MEDLKGKKALNIISLMAFIALLGKILGLFRDILLNTSYGATREGMAFHAASVLPSLFLDAMFAAAISASFIPVFNEYLERHGKERAILFSNNLLTIIAISTTAVAGLGIIFANPLVNLYVPGYDSETIAITVRLLRILFPTLIMSAITFSVTGILQSFGEFFIPQAISVMSNTIIISYFLIFHDRLNIYTLASVYLLGWLCQFMMQVPSLKRNGYRYRPIINLKEEGLLKVRHLLFACLVSTWVLPVNMTINTSLGSSLYNGVGLIGIKNANTIFTIIVGVLTLSVVNAIFPSLSRYNASKKHDEFAYMIKNSMKSLLFVIIPIAFGIMALCDSLIRLMFQYGEFTPLATAITSKALFFYAIGMVGYSIQQILVRAFFAKNNARVPLVAGIIGMVSNYTVAMLFIDTLDIGALGLAASASFGCMALYLLYQIQKEEKRIITKDFVTDIFKMLLCGFLMAGLVYYVKSVTFPVDTFSYRLINVVAPTVIGMVLYFALAYMLKLPEITFILSYVKRKVNK